jgi:hypothetical protein
MHSERNTEGNPMAHKVRPVPALDPGALRVGYSGLPEDEEKERLQQDDWKLPVEKVNYRGTEYWIPLEKRVGYSGLPENEEKKGLQQEWGKEVEKVNYGGTEYWVPLQGKTKPAKKPEKGKPKDD